MINQHQRSIFIDNALLAVNSLLLVATFLLFRIFPPAIDTYISSSYDSVDVILSKAFVVTILLYLMSLVLVVTNIVRLFKLKRNRRSMSVNILRIVTFLLFIGVTLYLLGYLGFYNTFDINFVMPFRAYHPPF